MQPSMRPQTGARTRGFFDDFTVPQQQTQQRSAPVRDTTLSQPVGGGSSAGTPPLDVYGQGSRPAERDLSMNPLTENEMTGYKAARTVGSILLGPIGLGLFSAAEYGMGKQGYNPAVDNALRDDAMFANTYNAGRVAEAFPGSTPAQRAETALASSKMGRTLGAKSDYILGSGGFMMDSSGNMTMPDWGSGSLNSDALAAQANAQPGDALDNLMSNTDAFGTSSSSSWSSPSASDSGGYAYSPTTDSSTGGFSASWADGGMVGLTGPRHDQSPANLTQMGFADGGGVGLGTPAGSTGPDQLQEQVNQFVHNPQFKQVAQQVVGNAMASGELTPEELITLGRIAEAAMHNPSLYPQLRQFASQNGLTPLPPSYDPRLTVVLIAASKLMGSTPPGQVPPTDQAQMQNPTGMANGGFLRGPGTGRSDSIGTVEESTGKPVKVANGEYVIPSHVVAAKGKDFFDKMLRQYAQLTPQE